LIFYNL